MTIKEAASSFQAFSEGLQDEIVDSFGTHSQEITDIIRQQLMVGIDGNEDRLSPSYLSDPWFSTEDAGPWKGRSTAYMLWKKKITPPAPSVSWLGYPARPVHIPNLCITGKFHSSIKALRTDTGLTFVSEGTPFGGDIVAKYGADILKVGSKGCAYIGQTWVKPRLVSYFKMHGL